MNKTPKWTVAVAALAALCAALLAATTPAWAQEQDVAVADPPGRVGRISALVGAVEISRQAGDAWERAQINQPVTGQTALRSPPGSQAEVRIGSTSVRLDADTQAVFSQLDDHAIAIDVAQGTVRVRLRSLPTGDAFSLSADAVRAEAQGPGDYRVGYDPDLRAYTLRALAGELRVVTPTNTYNLEAGQESRVENGGQSVQLHAMGERDDFDAWAEARDGQQDALTAARYVSPETTGIEALDEHGRWNVTDEYGPVWYPRTVRSGWAPYRYGHWAHVHPWGWTWVDDAPWGFAPFHYGRWAMIDSRWGWVPGPIVARPVWSPALVGYVGGYSNGVSVSIGIGSPVGWFPLGPHEIYHPPFRYSQRYWDHVNWRHKHRDHRDGKQRHDDDGRHHRDRDRDGHGDRGARDDRRMTRQPIPGYRYAKQADALTVVR
nr:hypothetical protein [Methylibium sp.]